MEKTCRTRDALQAYCHAAGVLPPGGGSFSCGLWNKRETPLLVDVLAKALNDMVEIFNRADDADIYPDSCQGFDEAMQVAFAALARYQEEVGDA